MYRYLIAISGLFLLSGCAALAPAEAPKAAPEAAQMTPKPLGNDEILSRLSALPAQELAPGTCGLFLWLRRDDAPLIFFQTSREAAASMILDGASQSLARRAQGQLIAFNFFDRQRFSNGTFDVAVRITPEDKRSIRQGIKIETGTVSITGDDGWSASLPVAGIIGCK